MACATAHFERPDNRLLLTAYVSLTGIYTHGAQVYMMA